MQCAVHGAAIGDLKHSVFLRVGEVSLERNRSPKLINFPVRSFAIDTVLCVNPVMFD